MLGLTEMVLYIASRLFDLVISLLVLVALAPLLVVVIIALLAESRQPVLIQETVRTGSTSTLKLFRFRTAVQGPSGYRVTTPLGNLLVNSRLEDTPVLLNILRADISLCGYALNQFHSFYTMR